ncbi:uncharacterized protein [Symphalangus syndactylus]|uniref:uncharacterized protein n=1 Tax=Symphalangus syndactylus TaxID=9590 RepID=UPI003006C99A
MVAAPSDLAVPKGRRGSWEREEEKLYWQFSREDTNTPGLEVEERDGIAACGLQRAPRARGGGTAPPLGPLLGGAAQPCPRRHRPLGVLCDAPGASRPRPVLPFSVPPACLAPRPPLPQRYPLRTLTRCSSVLAECAQNVAGPKGLPHWLVYPSAVQPHLSPGPHPLASPWRTVSSDEKQPIYLLQPDQSSPDALFSMTCNTSVPLYLLFHLPGEPSQGARGGRDFYELKREDTGMRMLVMWCTLITRAQLRYCWALSPPKAHITSQGAHQ